MRKALVLMAVAGAMAAAPGARAEDDALLKLIEVLHDNGTISDEAYHMLIETASGPEATVAPTPTEAPAQPSYAGDDSPSADLEPRFSAGGRLHLDTARFDEDEVRFGNNSRVRRIRLETKVDVTDNWRASAAIEFADNEVDLKSTYFRYSGFDHLTLSVGNFKEPFSLEELSSSNGTIFMERAMLADFAPGRHVGIGIGAESDSSAIAAGLFGGGISSETEDDAGWGASARYVFLPVHDDRRVVHIGAALSYRATGDDDTYRVRSRPESGVTDVRLVDTGTLADVDDVTLLGLELAAINGPLTLQGEYVAASVDRSIDSTDLDFSGWYTSASWILTGETRSYKAGDGEMGTVVPFTNVGEGGMGAWEVAARYSTIDLNDGALVGGRQENLTLGLNWYLNPNMRLMFNVVDVLEVQRPGTPEDGDEPRIYQLRMQFDY